MGLTILLYTDAERYVVEATREGRWAEFPVRVNISAGLIRRLMMGLPPSPDEEPVPTPCGVRITNATIVGPLNLNNGRGAGGTVMPGLVLDECEIAEGIDLSYAQLGKLSLERAAITELRAVRAVIEGELIANDIRPLSGSGSCFISMHSVHVDGDIQFRRAVLRETDKLDEFERPQFAIDLRNATVNGSIYLRDLDCIGTVNLSLARVEGHVTLRSSLIVPRAGNYWAVLARDSVVKGAITMRAYEGKPFESRGEISLSRSHLGAAVFDGAVIAPDRLECQALDMHGAVIDGRLHFRDGFRTTGKTILQGVIVGADMSAHAAMFAAGVDATGLKVGGDCDFSDAVTENDWITLKDARIARTLHVGGVRAHLDLKRAHARTFDDLGQCAAEGHIYLDGFVYERLERPGPQRQPKKTDVQRLKWLSRQGEGHKYRNGIFSGLWHWVWGSPPLHVKQGFYTPQTFVQLSRVLADQGLDSEARQILRAKQWIEARHRGGIRGLPLGLFGLLFGFGYSSQRAATVLVIYFLTGWGSFFFAEKAGLLSYDPQPVAAFADRGHVVFSNSVDEQSVEPDHLPCSDIDAAYYALDLMVPLIDLHIEEKCEVRRSPGDMTLNLAIPLKSAASVTALTGGKINLPSQSLVFLVSEADVTSFWRFFHAAYAMLGWLVVSLAILTFSGVLRQKDRFS